MNPWRPRPRRRLRPTRPARDPDRPGPLALRARPALADARVPRGAGGRLARGLLAGGRRRVDALCARAPRPRRAARRRRRGPRRARGSSGSSSTGRSCRSAPSSSASTRRTPRASAAYILAHSEAVLAFVEDDAQREKLASVQAELPALREIVALRRAARARGRGPRDAASTRRARQPRARSRKTTSRRSSTRRARPARRRAACSRTRTSSRPRSACARTSRTAATSSSSSCRSRTASGGSRTSRRRTTARRVALVADATRVAEALGAVRPTILPAVPRIYEKIHAGVLDQIESADGREARARALGARRRRAREPPPPHGPARSARRSACRSASPTSSSSRR